MPARTRATLLIFDRNFDDLLVDQRRYRLSGTNSLVRILRHLMPHPQITFVLSAPAAILQQRKPELPVAELERQQIVLREIAGGGKRYVLVSAEASPERVAENVWREVVSHLAAREAERS